MTENAHSILGRIVFAVAAAALFAVVFLIDNPIVQLVLALTAAALGICALSRRWSTRLADILLILPP